MGQLSRSGSARPGPGPRPRLGADAGPPCTSPRTPTPTGCSRRSRWRVMIGMLLDQQVPMEWAFTAPALLKERLGGGPLDATAIARMDPAALEAIFRDKPALHRYPGSMAKRTHALCGFLVEQLRRPRRRGVERRADRRRAVRAGRGAPRLRSGEGPDLRRPVGQATRRDARRAGRRSRPTGRRSPTSTRSNASLEIREQKRAMKAAAKKS